MVQVTTRNGYVILGVWKERNGSYKIVGVSLPKELAEKRVSLSREIWQQLDVLASEYREQTSEYFRARKERVHPLVREIHAIDGEGVIESRTLETLMGCNYEVEQILYT